jgi:hypothetical protein
MKPRVGELKPIKNVYTLKWFEKHKNLSFEEMRKFVADPINRTEVQIGDYWVSYLFLGEQLKLKHLLEGKNWLLFDNKQWKEVQVFWGNVLREDIFKKRKRVQRDRS